MSSFNTINGVPASANPFTLTQVLRKEWQFDGVVVSDYESVRELLAHGIAADEADAAQPGPPGRHRHGDGEPAVRRSSAPTREARHGPRGSRR